MFAHAALSPISVEPISSLPTVEKIYAPNVYPFPPVAISPAAAMDDEGAVDEGFAAKVAREVLDDMLSEVVAENADGERQPTAEPRVPRFPPTPAACCHAQTDDRCSPP